MLSLVRWLLGKIVGWLLDAILDTWAGKIITVMLTSAAVSIIGALKGLGLAESLTLGLIALAASAKVAIDVGRWRESRRLVALGRSVDLRTPSGIAVLSISGDVDVAGGVFLVCPEVIVTNSSSFRMALEIVAVVRLQTGTVECRPEMLAQNLTFRALANLFSPASLRLLKGHPPLPHPVSFSGSGAQSGHLVLRVPGLWGPRYDDEDDDLQALANSDITWRVSDLLGAEPNIIQDKTPRPREVL